MFGPYNKHVLIPRVLIAELTPRSIILDGGGGRLLSIDVEGLMRSRRKYLPKWFRYIGEEGKV